MRHVQFDSYRPVEIALAAGDRVRITAGDKLARNGRARQRRQSRHEFAAPLPAAATATATTKKRDERCDRARHPGERVYHHCSFDNRHKVLLVLSAKCGVT
jgi:hypothetical protein